MRKTELFCITLYLINYQANGQEGKVDIKDKDLSAIEYKINGKTIKRIINIFDFALTDSLNRNNIEYETVSLSYEVKDSKGQSIYKQLVGLDRVFDQDRINYEYNSKGQLIKEIAVDDAGNVKAGYSDIAIYEYKYDQDGNKVEERFIDEKGKLIQLEFVGPAIIKFKYDKKNRKIEEAYFDIKDIPLKGFCRVVYEYDNADNVSKKTMYDNNGNIIKKD